MSDSKFEVGETVTYYPLKKGEDDNRHWPAEILGCSGARYRVKINAPPPAGRSVGHRAPPGAAG